ncbi:MAG: LCP family protein [Chlorobia bacterium]|nr:LCP family protein [Fimbriimonadaceae bacterium]
MKWLKWILYGFVCVACLAVGAFGRVAANVVDAIGGGKKSFSEVIGTLRDPKATEFPTTDELTILLVGQDYNRDRKSMPYTKNSRADTIMLLRANLQDKTVRACSIPRDTYIQAADQLSGKINGTLARGGVDLLKRTLEQMFGLTIDHHVMIKPSAVQEIVDAVGGVQVEAIDDMKYDDSWGHLHIDIKQGRHLLMGQQAEGYVRFRKMNSGQGRSEEEGDLRRTARQQQLVQAMMASANNATNLMRVDEIIETGFGQIDTSLTRSQCVALALIFKGAGTGNMLSATVPGTDGMVGDQSVFNMDFERAQGTVDWLIKGDDLAMKRLVRIEVRNGTKAPGVAKLAADMLESQGYSAKAPGNAPAAKVTTIVYRKASFETAARDIQRVLGATSITKEVKPANEWDPEIEIVIGDDVAQKVKPPAAEPD